MTKIEWTKAPGFKGETWNPTTGCTRVSAGCDHCYAVKQTHRLENMGLLKKYGGLTVLNSKGDRHFNGVVKCHEHTLEIPLRWRKPRMVFVNSMSDLFHEAVPFEFIDRVFAVMALCPQHTFQVLTKRPERMAEYFSERKWGEDDHFEWTRDALVEGEAQSLYEQQHGEDPSMWLAVHWPLPNVWLGTSVEDQPSADQRIPHLLKCPAAVRFLSCEPLLGALNVERAVWTHARDIKVYQEGQAVDWVIVGCESRGAFLGRFADEYAKAASSIIEQCRDAGVPAFHKQMPIKRRVSHDMSKWPEPLCVRQWPAVTAEVV